MRARLGIDKTKSWADWAEEEEEAAEPTKTLADAMVDPVRRPQFQVWPEFAMTDFRMSMPSSPPSSTPAVAETTTITASEVAAKPVAGEPAAHAATYAPVEACGAHEWSYIAHGWRAVSAACGPESDASAHGQEGGGGGALTEGGQQPLLSLSMRLRGGGPAGDATAHGQEGDGGGGLTEGGLPRHASAHGQEGGGGGTLTEGGPPRHESAVTHDQRQAIRNALQLQVDEVDVCEVRDYVLEALGVKLSKKVLIPIINELLDEEEAGAAAAAARESSGGVRLYHKIRAPRAYDLDNCVVREAVSDALKLQGDMLKLQGDMVRLGEVQAYVFEALSIKPAKNELRPIVETMLYEEERQTRLRENKRELDRVQAAGHQHDLVAILAIQEVHLTRFCVQWPDASPFDGVTKITSHNAWRYSASVPDLRKSRGMATRTPDSEPGRFYWQVMGKEWDGESHSYKLAVSRFRELQYRRQRTGFKRIASDAAVTAASAPTAASQSLPERQHARACEQAQHLLEQGREKLRKIASAEPASFTAALASIEQQPLPPPLKPLASPPPSLPPSPPDSDGEDAAGGTESLTESDTSAHGQEGGLIKTSAATKTAAAKPAAAKPAALTAGVSAAAKPAIDASLEPAALTAAAVACGPKSDASTHDQDGGGGGALTEGGQQPLLSLSMRLRGGGPDASAHGQEGIGGSALTEGGLPRHASAHGQLGDGGGSLTEGGLLCHSPDNEPPTSEPADRQRQAISDAERRRDREQWRAARDERERAAHAERQRQQPPEMLIDFESLRKLERKAERMGYSAAAYWDERIEEAKEICPEWLAELRREFDGETRLTAEDSAFGSEAPSLRNYRNKAKRTRDSLPARFYRMIEGEEWDGEAHSYSKARKKYRRWEEPYQQRERQRQQRKKRDYSKKKRPADDNARRQARRIAQREREKATLAASASAHGQEGGGGGSLTEGGQQLLPSAPRPPSAPPRSPPPSPPTLSPQPWQGGAL